MTHNISTAYDAAERPDRALSLRRVSDLPQGGVEEIWSNPVLTVTHNNGSSHATLLFHGGDTYSGGPQVVVNPWHLDHEGAPVRIIGEDLYALRELLNEMPEEAFVRPADPVKAPPAWAPGDHITNTQYALDYVKVGDEWSHDDVWVRITMSKVRDEVTTEADTATDYTDLVIEEMLAKNPQSYEVVVKSADS